MDGWMDGWREGGMDGMEGGMDRWMDGWMDGRTDGWMEMDGWMDGFKVTIQLFQKLVHMHGPQSRLVPILENFSKQRDRDKLQVND